MSAVRTAIAAALLFFSVASMDPMLVHAMFVGACVTLFPAMKLVLVLTGILGAYRILVRHDPIMGTAGSFLSCAAEGVDVTLTGALTIVTVMVCLPALSALFAFDVRKIWAELAPAVPYVTILVVKFMVENQVAIDVGETIKNVRQYADQGVATVKALVGAV